MSVTLSIEDRVATLTIDRPEARNAMTREMWFALADHLRAIEHDPDVGCVLLTGTGKAFCAGGDVKAMVARAKGEAPQNSVEADASIVRQVMESSRLLHEMAKPTLAAINGACAGAGFSLAMACDLRLANADAKFTTAFAGVGAAGDFGGSWFLSKMIGTAKTRELYYFASVFSGRAAEEMGIVNRAFAAEDLTEAARDWAQQLAKGPSVAFGYMKRNINLAEQGTLSQALDQEALHMVLSMRSNDHEEAAKAFVEKRKPNFTGR